MFLLRRHLPPVLILAFGMSAVPASRAYTHLIELPEPRTPSVSVHVPRYAPTAEERDIVTACLVLEAASQGEFGLRGVMSVIRNRARGQPELFAPTVLRPFQFSAMNRATSGGAPLSALIERARRDRMWPVARALVDEACGEIWHDPTEGATHYTRSTERVDWTRRLARTTIIGAHAFYR